MLIGSKFSSKIKYFVFLAFFFSNFAFALDKTKYIGVDEIKRGMDAYCLTVLAGTEPKKYPLKVVSVVHNMKPGHDRILVMGTDEAFKHIGPVQGCSGSPVYIDGRMAGALSAGWGFSTDPLYAVTPIDEMLRVGSVTDSVAKAKGSANLASLDFSKPIDLYDAGTNVLASLSNAQKTASGLESLPCPLVTSFSSEICQSLAGDLKNTGLVPLAGGGTNTTANSTKDAKYVPGGVLSIPLASGDISMAAIGTVTEVIGDKVYGFGHSFLGQGAVDLPMASGMVHTVVSNMQMSFKLGTAGKIDGAIRADEETAIFGKVGLKSKLIPLRIKINRFDAVQPHVYNCKLAYHKLYTPAILQAAIAGAAMMQGPLPAEHTVRYSSSIAVKGYDPITINNISSGASIGDAAGESVGVVALLMNNTFGDVDIESLDFEINIEPDNLLANFSSIQLDDVKVKAGKKVNASFILQSTKTKKTAYRMELPIPRDLKPGNYKVLLVGNTEYSKFIRQAQPHRFTARDLDSLIEAIRYVVSNRRDRAYMLLSLPSPGVTIEGKELPDLPGSKTMLLRSPTRTIITQPLAQWIQSDLDIPFIIKGGKAMQITVERP